MSGSETITARAEERGSRIDDRLAVLIPCFNEETAIARVVTDFRAELPEATIYVYDNNSTDRTLEVARAAGALVRRETHQGKGNVVRRESRRRRRLIGPATAPATGCSPASSLPCSARASPTSCPAIACSRAGS
jgi:cellulose synthase/poly-beta-1,6-N-acetylglucosamine synthase-like glycosyltransferase